MALLIDGYNLLHATDIFDDGRGPSALHSAREGLLALLATALDPKQLSQTTIIFDATDAPPGLPKSTSHAGMAILYARGYADADAMLEEFLEHHDAPRSLVVVSSDHRVQRAARRRGARPVDSQVWYAELMSAAKEQSSRTADAGPTKPQHDPSTDEVAYWTEQFTEPRKDSPGEKKTDDVIFPEGYGQDVIDEFGNPP